MKIGVIYIETTNFFDRGGFIVEVGIAELETTSGDVRGVFGSVCREPGMTASDRNAWIFENSDLTVEEVRSAPLLSDILPKIQAVVSTFDAVTAYNKVFDFTFLRDRGLVIDRQWPCPMKVATPVCKIPKTGRGAFYGGYKWPGVEEAWAHFYPDRPYVEEHRGLDDAMHEAEIVWALHKLGLMGAES